MLTAFRTTHTPRSNVWGTEASEWRCHATMPHNATQCHYCVFCCPFVDEIGISFRPNKATSFVLLSSFKATSVAKRSLGRHNQVWAPNKRDGANRVPDHLGAFDVNVPLPWCCCVFCICSVRPGLQLSGDHRLGNLASCDQNGWVLLRGLREMSLTLHCWYCVATGRSDIMMPVDEGFV